MITSLTVALDKEEYSRYDTSLSQITAQVTSVGGAGGDVLAWSVERTDGFGVVATGSVLWTSPLQTLIVDLNSFLDADGLNFATSGDYLFRVSSGTASGVASFYLGLISVDEFKRRWIYGVSLESSDLLSPVVPLRLLTGVTYLDASKDVQPEAFTLLYTPAAGILPATISADGGTAVPIMASGIQDIVLIVSCETGWIKLRINPALLPGVTTTEMLFLDRTKMDDHSLRQFIQNAATYVESFMHLAVEPRIAMTNLIWQAKNMPFTDMITQPVAWTIPYQYDTWLNFHIPVRRLLKIYDIRGYFNSSLSTIIPVDQWETHDEYTGVVTFIPKSGGALVTWQTVQATFMQFMFGRDIVQEFWHYQVAHGLRSLSIPEYRPVLEAIAKKASVDVLLQAGSALKAGISSESVSRDGVSESTSYTQSAMYGLYAHITIPYQEWLDENLPRLKRRIGGVEYVTL
jgi:hypothetical protein